jgi:hypothetical protein
MFVGIDRMLAIPIAREASAVASTLARNAIESWNLGSLMAATG